jgi:hypothetical protein
MITREISDEFDLRKADWIRGRGPLVRLCDTVEMSHAFDEAIPDSGSVPGPCFTSGIPSSLGRSKPLRN